MNSDLRGLMRFSKSCREGFEENNARLLASEKASLRYSPHYQEGRFARQWRFGEEDNPNKMGSRDHKAWLLGWQENNPEEVITQ